MKQLIIALTLIAWNNAFGQNVNDLLNQGNAALHGKGKNLSNEEIIGGLKEALTLGSKHAGEMASKMDGYLKNPAIKIPFPKDVKDVELTLRGMGMGNQVDDFITSLNRAAEDAAKEATPIFTDAVKNMSITDGLTILQGTEHAATDFLKSKTLTPLKGKFKPVISKSLSKMGVAHYWKILADIYNKLPLVKKVNPNLIDYTTGKALDGLFYLVAQEEAKIRKDPAAQVTDLLKKVFGGG